MNIEGMVSGVLEQLRTVAKTENVVGEEFKIGNFYAKPVMKISMGIGGGGAEGTDQKAQKGHSGGSGGGVKVEPIGFLVANDEKISFLSTDSKNLNITGIMDKVPDLMEKMIKMKKEDKEK